MASLFRPTVPPNAQEYSTLWRSLYTMFAAAVGEFDSKTYLAHHNPGMTLPLFVVYLFIVAIILLNLLVALLTNSFQKAHALSICSCMPMRARSCLSCKPAVQGPLDLQLVTGHGMLLEEVACLVAALPV